MASVEVIAHVYVVVMQQPYMNTSTNVAAWQTRVEADRHVSALSAQNPRASIWIDHVPVYGNQPMVIP